jgi:class 3 adenylate cyclase
MGQFKRDLEKKDVELDRRVYHLKTLNDVSKDIFSSVDSKSIIRNFLLMSMGTFGVLQGFIITTIAADQEIEHFNEVCFKPEDLPALKNNAIKQLRLYRKQGPAEPGTTFINPELLSPHVACALPFQVSDDCFGLLVLGSKLIGEPYSDDDKELMGTLLNSLVVSLKNARSFEKIKRLNIDLQKKNIELEKMLKELQAALRKVEILESIKSNLTKFVPTAVSKMVENSPTSEFKDAQEQDISVLFLDIEGYTKITDEIGATNVNTLIEKYFSVFMDAIYANNGDIVETAGDGLMVLFLSDDEKKHASQAVRTALTVREEAHRINSAEKGNSKPLPVNIGICSGSAFVGASKFESLTGSRWVYTTHGTVVNIAARLCSKAKGGEVLVSKSTIQRVKELFTVTYLGVFPLKNLAEDVDIYAL